VLKDKRDRFLRNAPEPLHDNGINPHRWVCSDELTYCLRSIEMNAPWVRCIWIVTDQQRPLLPNLSATFANKIRFVDHRDIFAGYEDALPTFNSLSIETMLWRIEGLSEHFLYFNDDVFLTAPVTTSDFFTKAGPVLRGKWADYSHLPNCDSCKTNASLLNQYNQIKCAELLGYSANNVFSSAHVVHPIQRSIMLDLFNQHQDSFARNATYRFRSTEQFLPQSLHNHACLKSGRSKIVGTCDYLHIAVGAFQKWPLNEVQDYFRSAFLPQVKFLCVNDLPDVEHNFPSARDWIEQAIGLESH
jgi:Stealth protein CR2, conserved region 2